MIWVVNANSNTCRIYQYDKKHNKLSLVKEIQHPENKLRSGDMISDRPGHYKSSTSAHGAYSQASDPKEVKIDNFYREISKTLEHERNKNSFNELIIISPPHLNGLLFQHLDEHVKNLIKHNIKKDLLHLTDHELTDFLQAHTQFQA